MNPPVNRNICFHGVGPVPPGTDSAEAAYWVSVDLFRSILDELTTWPRVTISFDDGNRSDLEIALPELVERGLHARFFVVAGRLTWARSLDDDAVRTLVGAGMAIGSHGMTHVPWRGLSEVDAQREIVDSRAVLSSLVGHAIDEAALPLGRYDRTTLARARRAGIRVLHTSDRRPAQPGAWLQHRFSIRATDTPSSLRTDVLPQRGAASRARAAARGWVKRLR